MGKGFFFFFSFFLKINASNIMHSWNEQQASWDKLTLRVSGASEMCLAPSWGLTTLSSQTDAAVKAALLSDGGNREIINCYSPVCIYICVCFCACVCAHACIRICCSACALVFVCVCIRLQSQCLWWQGNETSCLKALWVNQSKSGTHPSEVTVKSIWDSDWLT